MKKLAKTLVVSALLLVPVAAMADDDCRNAAAIAMTQILLDRGQGVPPQWRGYAAALRDLPDVRDNLREFIQAAADLNYSGYLAGYAYEAHCRGLDLFQDFSVCDPGCGTDTGECWDRVRSCVLRLAGGGK